jgi:NAD-dependent deacetylase
MTDLPDQTLDALDFAAELITQAKHAIALTGAGISTPSGIPDFRSEGKGLWAKDEPLEVASQATFRAHPEKFFAWFHPLARSIFDAVPNPAHKALAALQEAGKLQTIITQNIDVLHQKAGSKRVIEMHGTLATLTCTQCYQKADYQDYLPQFIEKQTLPHCPACGALLKPDVILFGEQLPQKAWYQAQAEARKCDLMLVIGSSLEVLPVAGLPMQAIDRGAHLVIINNAPTYISVRADLNIYADAARIIPEIVQRVLKV